MLRVAIALLVLGVAARPAAAEDRCLQFHDTAKCLPGRVGVGFGLFAASGLTLEALPHRRVVLDFAGGRNAHLDDKWTVSGAVTTPVETFNIMMLVLPIYVGAGVAWVEGEGGGDDQYAIRLPLGIRAQSVVVSFQMFIETAVRIPVTPDLDPGLEATVGFRYFVL